jgi:Pentapeptide repeats (8 copies)
MRIPVGFRLVRLKTATWPGLDAGKVHISAWQQCNPGSTLATAGRLTVLSVDDQPLIEPPDELWDLNGLPYNCLVLRSRRRLQVWSVRYAARALVGLTVFVGLAVVVGLAVLLVWRVPPLLYAYVPDLNQRAVAEASTRTGFIAGLAGLAALGGLAMSSRTYRLTQQGQITDRYTNAIEQLGNEKLDVRLGGIYALERIAVDSKRDHSTVVEVLGAFVRERTAVISPEKLTVEDRRPEPKADVQAAVAVLSRLPRRQGVSRGDLRGAILPGVQLENADLFRARLRETKLSKAALWCADLTDADLCQADLSGANLMVARLSGADLREADLSDANVGGADLSDTDLRYVDLSGANLLAANLSGADLREADLSGATLVGPGLPLVPQMQQRVFGLTQQQIDATKGDATTQLPHGLHRPARW